jgi:hypothetical protein
VKRDKAWPPELTALARLLRDVDDCTALVQNALVAPQLAGVAGDPDVAYAFLHLRVRAAVLSAVASLDAAPDRPHDVRASRQRAIITRCDLRGEKHAAVARDLGICLRHFYRERRRALERLLVALSQRLAVPASVSLGAPSRFELDLDHVAMLRLTGQFQSAFEQIASIARAAPRAADGVRAWCYAVELAADVDDGIRARQFFAEAVRASRDLDEDDIATAAVDVEMASAFASWQTLDFEGATRSIESAVKGIERLEPSRDKTRSRAAVGILFRGSEIACLRGRPREGLNRLAAARSILELMPHKPPDLTAQLFLELSVVHGLTLGGTGRAIEYATEALETFRACGSSMGVAAAAGSLCTFYASAKEYVRALELGSLALDLTRSRGSMADVANHALILSQAATLSGDAARGLALAQFARENANGGLFETRSLIAMAEAYLALRDYGSAAKLARRVGTAVAPETWDRYQGVALRIQAEASQALGDRQTAAQCIGASIEHLERHGHPPSLKRAYEFSGRLGGRREHQRLARELERGFEIEPSAYIPALVLASAT